MFANNELAAQLAETSPDLDLVNQTQARIDKLHEGIGAWRTVLNYTDTTLEQALNGELELLDQLMPDDLMDGARNLDMSMAKDAPAALKTYDTISFTGGGHAVCVVDALTPILGSEQLV